MPQSIVFIYQNVCKKVSSSILQYSYVIFSTLACGFVFIFFHSMIPFDSITYAALTYSTCVPYADTISYKFHLVIFLKNILILSAKSDLAFSVGPLSPSPYLTWLFHIRLSNVIADSFVWKSVRLLSVIRHLIACYWIQIIAEKKTDSGSISM